MISAYTLFSSSSGNCTYVKCGSVEVLIDAGASMRSIEQSLTFLGTSLENIKAIFITHEHSDHMSGLEIISKRYNIPVHMTYPSYDKGVRDKSYLKRSAIRHDIEFTVTLEGLSVKSFVIPHDSAQNVGYILSENGKKCLGTATDIGHVTEEIAYALKGCEHVILEANHDIEMLKNGSYPEYVKERILSSKGHLSNKNAARLACYLAENGVKHLTLAHLSEKNNTPALARDTVCNLLKNNNLSLDVAVASPSEPTFVTR